MMTPEEALAEGAVPVHDEYPNLCWQQPQIKGDAEKALAEAAAVVEADFSTQMNHQAPLEPEVSIAYLEGEGEDAQLVVMGRSIMIHTHMAMLQGALGWENMRYEEPFVGGQFGIKAAIVTEAIVGAAALHFKRPVRYVPSLEESMLLSNKRHPFAMKVKLAADKDGKLTAYVNDFVIDNGAYQILGIVVGIRPCRCSRGSYDIPNVKSLAKLVYTNNAPGGAARGAGPPQVAFALESAMDMLADKLGIDPLDIRIKNSLAPGRHHPLSGQPLISGPLSSCAKISGPTTRKPKLPPPLTRTAPSSAAWAWPATPSAWVSPATTPWWPWNWILTTASPSMRPPPIRAKAMIPC